jgi:hypothetical protein
VDLKAATFEYAEKARAGIEWLAPSVHRDSLRNLVDYVTASAIP